MERKFLYLQMEKIDHYRAWYIMVSRGTKMFECLFCVSLTLSDTVWVFVSFFLPVMYLFDVSLFKSFYINNAFIPRKTF